MKISGLKVIRMKKKIIFIKDRVKTVNTNEDKKKYNRSKPPSYFILLLVDRYKGKYILPSEFHKQVNHILVDNGIPHLSPQQIRIFVNLHGYSIVKMNGYKFLC